MIAGLPVKNARLSGRAWIIVGALTLAYYLLLARTRRIDGDEGYFLYAARLVLEGKLPYRDFFFPQLPLLPYLWGGLLAPIGVGWISGRMVAALLATATALVFLHLSLRRVAPRAAILLFLAYLSSDFGLEWAVVIKTYLPVMFFLSLAWLVARASGRPSPWHWGLAGLLAGLALLSRLTVAPLLLIMLAVLIWDACRARRRWLHSALAWAAGLVPILAVLVYFWMADPQAFVYDNWQYHGLTIVKTLGERLRLNLPVLLDRLFLDFLWLGALALLAWERRRRPLDADDWFYRLSVGVILVVSLIPIRSYHQYYCLATPWLLLAAAPAAQSWVGVVWRPFQRQRRRLAAAWGVVGLLLLAWQPLVALKHSWPTWIPDWAPIPRAERIAPEFDLRLGVVRWVSRRIDQLAPPGSELLTWWPGYAVEARTPLVAGMESHFGLKIGRLGSAHDAATAHVLTEADVVRLIRAEKPGIIVPGIWAGMEGKLRKSNIEQLLYEQGYAYKGPIGQTSFYVRQAPS